MRDTASITTLVQNGGLSVLSSIKETDRSRVIGGQQLCCFWSEIPVEKENVRWLQFFCRQSSVRSLHTFSPSHYKTSVVCGIDRLVWQDEFFMNIPLDVKENDEHACDFALLSPLSVSVSSDFPCMAHAFFPECLSNYCQGFCSTFSEICIKFDALPLLDPSRNCIRLDTRLQIN
jgi:hypothetical protein